MNHSIDDPYRNCEAGQCNHDLARAVTIPEMLAADGPYPPSHLIVNLGWSRPSLFEEAEETLEVRRAG